MSGRTAIVALLSGLGVDDEDIADEVVEYLQTIAEDDDADVESFKECLVGFFEQLGEHAELDSAVQATFDTMRGKVGGTAVAAAPAAPAKWRCDEKNLRCPRNVTAVPIRMQGGAPS